MTTPDIQTPRLTLHPLVPADAPALFAYRALPEVSRYQSFAPAALSDAEAFVEKLQGAVFDVEDTWFQLGIRLKDTAELIGDMGLHFCPDRQVEIGFTLAPTHQRQGLASEAVNAVLEHLFALDKHRIFASIDPRNGPSAALLQRVGMRKEAHFIQSLWMDGEWVDDVVFAQLKSEWDERTTHKDALSSEGAR